MSAPTWSLVKRKAKDLKPHPKNPRRLLTDDAAHLQISMEKFGIIEKIVINTDNQIIGGHQRWRLLKKSGHKEVDCYIPDRTLDEREVEELLIRLNKNSGQFDQDILANEFEGLDLLDWGFKAEELFGSAYEEKKPKGEKEPKENSSKKLKTCPSCGHEF